MRGSISARGSIGFQSIDTRVFLCGVWRSALLSCLADQEPKLHVISAPPHFHGLGREYVGVFVSSWGVPLGGHFLSEGGGHSSVNYKQTFCISYTLARFLCVDVCVDVEGRRNPSNPDKCVVLLAVLVERVKWACVERLVIEFLRKFAVRISVPLVFLLLVLLVENSDFHRACGSGDENNEFGFASFGWAQELYVSTSREKEGPLLGVCFEAPLQNVCINHA